MRITQAPSVPAAALIVRTPRAPATLTTAISVSYFCVTHHCSLTHILLINTYLGVMMWIKTVS